MADLQSSVWAPLTGNRHSTRRVHVANAVTTTSAAPMASTPADLSTAIDQHDRLFQRLEWKSQLLMHSTQVYYSKYKAFIDGPYEYHFKDLSEETVYERADEYSVALTQTKLDYVEFYSLLERTLVHLLGIFLIRVARTDPDADRLASSSSHASPAKSARTPVAETSAPQSTPLKLIGPSKGPGTGTSFTHAFHQNVLLALDAPGPLHEVLGQGEVREWLGFAKDLRNQYKESADKTGRGDGEGEDEVQTKLPESLPRFTHGGDAEAQAMMEEVAPDYVLRLMLQYVLEGLRAARPAIVKEQKAIEQQSTETNTHRHTMTNDEILAMEVDEPDVPFEVWTEDMEIG